MVLGPSASAVQRISVPAAGKEFYRKQEPLSHQKRGCIFSKTRLPFFQKQGAYLFKKVLASFTNLCFQKYWKPHAQSSTPRLYKFPAVVAGSHLPALRQEQKTYKPASRAEEICTKSGVRFLYFLAANSLPLKRNIFKIGT